jgi:hypothetical protein
MYTLTKLSRPGWTKKYSTIEQLTQAVRDGTCKLCVASYGADLQSMLASDCGCEYEVEGLALDEPETDFEALERVLRGAL